MKATDSFTSEDMLMAARLLTAYQAQDHSFEHLAAVMVREYDPAAVVVVFAEMLLLAFRYLPGGPAVNVEVLQQEADEQYAKAHPQPEENLR